MTMWFFVQQFQINFSPRRFFIPREKFDTFFAFFFFFLYSCVRTSLDFHLSSFVFAPKEKGLCFSIMSQSTFRTAPLDHVCFSPQLHYKIKVRDAKDIMTQKWGHRVKSGTQNMFEKYLSFANMSMAYYFCLPFQNVRPLKPEAAHLLPILCIASPCSSCGSCPDLGDSPQDKKCHCTSTAGCAMTTYILWFCVAQESASFCWRQQLRDFILCVENILKQ